MINIYNQLTLSKGNYLPPYRWALCNQLKTLRTKNLRRRNPREEGILSQFCHTESLPEFPDCWPALKISGSRKPTIMWAGSLKYIHIYLSIYRSIDRSIYLSIYLSLLGFIALENPDTHIKYLSTKYSTNT